MVLPFDIFGARASDPVADAAARIPQCSLGCLATYATSINCTATDFVCQCENPPNFATGLTTPSCILSACGILNSTAAIAAFTNTCGVARGSGATSLLPSVAVSTTPSSTAQGIVATSAQTTTAATVTSSPAQTTISFTGSAPSTSPETARETIVDKDGGDFYDSDKFIIAIVLSGVSLVLFAIILLVLLRRNLQARRRKKSSRNSMEEPFFPSPEEEKESLGNIRVEKGISMTSSHYPKANPETPEVYSTLQQISEKEEVERHMSLSQEYEEVERERSLFPPPSSKESKAQQRLQTPTSTRQKSDEMATEWDMFLSQELAKVERERERALRSLPNSKESEARQRLQRQNSLRQNSGKIEMEQNILFLSQELEKMERERNLFRPPSSNGSEEQQRLQTQAFTRQISDQMEAERSILLLSEELEKMERERNLFRPPSSNGSEEQPQLYTPTFTPKKEKPKSSISESLFKLTGEQSKKPKRPPLAYFLQRRFSKSPTKTPRLAALPVDMNTNTVPPSPPRMISSLSSVSSPHNSELYQKQSRNQRETQYSDAPSTPHDSNYSEVSFTPSENRAIGAVISAFRSGKVPQPATIQTIYRNPSDSSSSASNKHHPSVTGAQSQRHGAAVRAFPFPAPPNSVRTRGPEMRSYFSGSTNFSQG